MRDHKIFKDFQEVFDNEADFPLSCRRLFDFIYRENEICRKTRQVIRVFTVEASAEPVKAALKDEKASAKPPETDVFVEAAKII